MAVSVRRVSLVAGVVALGLWVGLDMTPLLSWGLLGLGVAGVSGAILIPSQQTLKKLQSAKKTQALPPGTPYS